MLGTLNFDQEISYIVKALERYTHHLIQETLQSVGRWLAHIEGFQEVLNEKVVITPQDIEAYSELWKYLVPENPSLQIRVAQKLAQRYPFDYDQIPKIRAALNLDKKELRDEFEYIFKKTPEETFRLGKERQTQEIPRQLRLESDVLQSFLKVLKWRRFNRGEVLFRQGETGDRLYIVISGRLCVLTEEPSPRILEWAGQGKVIGELALLTNEPRSATVVTARDSLLLELSKADFEEMLRIHPQIMVEMIKVMAERIRVLLRRTEQKQDTSIKTIAVVPLHKNGDVGTELSQLLSRKGKVLYLASYNLDAQIFGTNEIALKNVHDNDMVVSWLNEQEAAYDFIVYEADLDATAWTNRCILQADYVLLIAHTDCDPALTAIETNFMPGKSLQIIKDLLLVHPRSELPRNTSAWVADRQVDTIYHDFPGDQTALGRIARRITGRTVGLVLSGGGSRCFAHLGVIKAFNELHIPIDVIGGTSAGALMGGAYAAGYTPDQIFSEGRKMFANTIDYTLPLVSLAAGKRFNDVLKSVFRDIEIEDLPLKFFAVSTNSTMARANIHDKGSLRFAIRASSGLPGIFPPVVSREAKTDLLVDGGILSNLPIDVMAKKCNGTIVAVDLYFHNLPSDTFDIEDSLSGFQYFINKMNPFSKRRYKAPSILTTIFQISSMSSIVARKSNRELSDLYITPPVYNYGLFDVEKAEELVQLGYESAKETLTGWLMENPNLLTDLFCDD